MFVGVDIGGTKVLAGEVDAHGTVVRTARRDTPGRRVPAALVEAALGEAVHEVAGGRRIEAVGLAAAGFVDVTRTRVLFAPHLPWHGEDVVARLTAAWNVPVIMDNDANCTALAETAYGAAREASSTVLVTLGTGIGGAVVLGGELWRGAGGMAGEFGHQQVVPGGLPCQCGRTGCWEQYCSGNALVRHARARLGASAVLNAVTGDDPGALTGAMVTEAASQGDPVALAAFAEVGDWLGVGLANLVAALDPALLVVGGGVSAAGRLLLDPARAALARSLVGAADRVVPSIAPAALGPEAGMIGAAWLARRWSRRAVGPSRDPVRLLPPDRRPVVPRPGGRCAAYCRRSTVLHGFGGPRRVPGSPLIGGDPGYPWSRVRRGRLRTPDRAPRGELRRRRGRSGRGASGRPGSRTRPGSRR